MAICTGCYKKQTMRRALDRGLEVEVCVTCGKTLDFAMGFLSVSLGVEILELNKRMTVNTETGEVKSPKK